MPRKEVHILRWQIALAFTVNVIAIVVVAIITTNTSNSNHEAIRELRINKASITALQHTNCRQKIFLSHAREARLRTAREETGIQRITDLSTAKAYETLIQSYTPSATGKCDGFGE